MIGLASWHWWLIAVALLLPAIGLIAVGFFGDRPRGRRRCPKCWYDMAGVTGLRCPECGRQHRAEHRLFQARRRRWAIAVGLLLAGAAVGPAVHPYMRAQSNGWWTYAPTWLLVGALAEPNDVDRWWHLSDRLAGDDEERRSYRIQPFQRELAFEFTWRRAATECTSAVLDPARDPTVRELATGILMRLPDRERIEAAIDRVVINSRRTDTDELVSLLVQYERRFQETHEDLAVVTAERFMREPAPPTTTGYLASFLMMEADDRAIRALLAAADDKCAPWAIEWLQKSLENWAIQGVSGDGQRRLAVIDALRSDPAIDVEIWGDELHRLREVLRALEVVSPFEAGYFVATRRELTDALEFAVALDEKLLYGGRIAEPLELVRLKYLARELAVSHQEETGGSSGKAAQMEAWEPIEPRDCDAVADRVSRGGRLLALHGSLPPSWVEAIPGEVCARDGCHHRERLATLLARDSTLHTEALKQILENSPCRRRLQTPILQGLRFGYAPVEHRLAFLGAWIAQVDLQDEDQREYLEWNRSFLLTEQEFLIQH